MKYNTSKPTVSKMPTLGKGTESIKKITGRGPEDYGSSARRLRVEGTEITGRGLKGPISYSHSDNLLHHWGTIVYLERDYRLGGITIISYTVNSHPLLCKVPYFTP